jgi:hypothetical protein
VLAYLTGKIKEGKVLHPVVIVHQFGTVRRIRLKIEELGKLGLHTLYIMLKCFLGKQVSLGRFARRVANHTCSTSDKRHRLMAATLEVTENHNGTKMPYVQRVGRRVETNIGCNRFTVKQVFCSGHYVVEHATPFQFFYKIVHRIDVA